MPPIPLESFRILNKKFGWEKSLDEIWQDDLEDINLYSSELELNDRSFFGLEVDSWGPWEDSSTEVILFWARYFVLVMRLQVKMAYLEVGTKNRGIPYDLFTQHEESIRSIISTLESLTLSTSCGHLTYFSSHLSEHRTKMRKKDFFRSIFKDHYISLVMNAYSLVKEEYIYFSDKHIDIKKLNMQLEERWLKFYNKVLN